MSKEPPSRRSKSTSTEPASTRLRRLAKLDLELVKLLNQRTTLAAEISGQANASDGEVPAPPPLADLLNEVVARSAGPLHAESLKAIFRELAAAAYALRRTLRVAFLGPEYSYSHLASLRRFGATLEGVPVGSIGAVFEEVNRGHAHFGLVPLENSTDGRVADTLDMFTRLRVRICGEVALPIHHCLLGKTPRAQVSEVYSRPQALSQCRNWLVKHLPMARTVEVTSTSIAAQLSQTKPGAAAIASREAGVHYGLDLLAENIEDNPGNVTRFAVIGDRPAPRSGRDKCALMFEIAHRPGSLADAMQLFKKNRLNLTWIESFPIPGPRTERSYLFFVELEGHENDLKVRRALASLERKTVRLEVLGSYPQGATE